MVFEKLVVVAALSLKKGRVTARQRTSRVAPSERLVTLTFLAKLPSVCELMSMLKFAMSAAVELMKGFLDTCSVKEVRTSRLGKSSARKLTEKLLPTKMRLGLRLYSLGGVVLVSPLIV